MSPCRGLLRKADACCVPGRSFVDGLLHRTRTCLARVCNLIDEPFKDLTCPQRVMFAAASVGMLCAAAVWTVILGMQTINSYANPNYTLETQHITAFPKTGMLAVYLMKKHRSMVMMEQKPMPTDTRFTFSFIGELFKTEDVGCSAHNYILPNVTTDTETTIWEPFGWSTQHAFTVGISSFWLPFTFKGDEMGSVNVSADAICQISSNTPMRWNQKTGSLGYKPYTEGPCWEDPGEDFTKQVACFGNIKNRLLAPATSFGIAPLWYNESAPSPYTEPSWPTSFLLIPFKEPADGHELRNRVKDVVSDAVKRWKENEVGNTETAGIGKIFSRFRTSVYSSVQFMFDSKFVDLSARSRDTKYRTDTGADRDVLQTLTVSSKICNPPPDIFGEASALHSTFGFETNRSVACKTDATLTVSDGRSWGTDGESSGLPECGFSSESGMPKEKPGCIPTVFRADFNQQVVRGEVTFQWSNFTSQWLSYFQTGLSLFAFLFSTAISVPFYYRSGEKARNYKTFMSEGSSQCSVACTV